MPGPTTVESELGRGSIFITRLPRVVDTPATETVVAPAQENGAGFGKFWRRERNWDPTFSEFVF